jgi:hypothetical protein
MPRHLWIVLPLLALLLAGCASWKAVPHDGTIDAKNDKAGPGYDVYRPEPYLLVVRGSINESGTTNTTGSSSTQRNASAVNLDQVTVKVIYLPNFRKAYRLSSSNFMAKADFTFNINNGWQLTNITDKSDNTTVITTAITALGTLMGDVLSARGSDKGINSERVEGTPVPSSFFDTSFALYKIEVDVKNKQFHLYRMEPEIAPK